MAQLSETLQNTTSINDVAEIINNNGTDRFDGNEIAGQYAYDAVDTIDEWDEEGREEKFEIAISYHFDALENAGANFDRLDAEAEAKRHFWGYINS